MTTGLVSIGIPCFNGENYLAEALKSVLAQDHDALEVIVADNASTDASLEIARAVASADPRVSILTADRNRGAAWNYNRLVDAATGEFFKWAAHDDLCASTFVSACVAAMRDDERIVLAYPQSDIVDARGMFVRHHEEDLGLQIDGPLRRTVRLLWRVRMVHAVFGVMRTDVLRRTRLIQPFDSSDVALLVELALRGHVAEVEGRLFLRRRHAEDSRSANRNSREVAEWFAPDRPRSGRSRPLITSYVDSAWRWAPGLPQAVVTASTLAGVGAVTEVRWHRRELRKARRARAHAAVGG